MEEWDLFSWCSHLLDLGFSVEGVNDSVSINDLRLNGNEVDNGVDKSFDGGLSHVQEDVLHDKLGLSQELLQFSHLIGLFGGFIDTVPWLSELSRDIGILSEISLYDVFDLVDPSFL